MLITLCYFIPNQNIAMKGDYFLYLVDQFCFVCKTGCEKWLNVMCVLVPHKEE